MRKITIKPLMDLIINTKAGLLGKIDLPDKDSIFIKNENKDNHIKNLIENGYTVLDNKLDENVVNEIVKFSEQIYPYDPYNDESTPVDRKNAPAKTHVAIYRREDLVRYRPIRDIANDPGLLQIVQGFLGARPTISNVNMWWSFGGRKQAEHAQLFHRDLDDWRFCKLFIYLTDVTEKSGPHIYVKNSSKSSKHRKIRRYKDSEIESTFGRENILKFVGGKGTAFLVDTYGFHKGLLPESDDRLLLQVQYSFYPIGIEKYEPVEIPNENEYNSYINRLIIK